MPKVVINVLKPFMFTFPARAGQKLTTERLFSVGEHEIDEEVANHPWIKAGADGKIESEEQAKARREAALKKAEQIQKDNEAATAAANAAAARIQAAQPGNKAAASEIEKELNTPVKDLQAKQAPGAAAKK